MTTLQLLSILISIAALFGWISARWLKLPTTIGTMLLTVLCSLALIISPISAAGRISISPHPNLNPGLSETS